MVILIGFYKSDVVLCIFTSWTWFSPCLTTVESSIICVICINKNNDNIYVIINDAMAIHGAPAPRPGFSVCKNICFTAALLWQPFSFTGIFFVEMKCILSCCFLCITASSPSVVFLPRPLPDYCPSRQIFLHTPHFHHHVPFFKLITNLSIRSHSRI